MVIFHSYVSLPEGTQTCHMPSWFRFQMPSSLGPPVVLDHSWTPLRCHNLCGGRWGIWLAASCTCWCHGKALPHSKLYIYMYILYTYNKVYRSIILYQVGLIMFGDLGGGQVVDALWMRCSAWDGVIWISSWVGQKEILRWLTQEAAERGDHLTVIVPTNNGMGWHGEDPVPSEYLRMPRRSSQGPTMPHWPRIHKKSNRPPDVWWCWPWYTMVYPSS